MFSGVSLFGPGLLTAGLDTAVINAPPEVNPYDCSAPIGKSISFPSPPNRRSVIAAGEPFNEIFPVSFF